MKIKYYNRQTMLYNYVKYSLKRDLAVYGTIALMLLGSSIA